MLAIQTGGTESFYFILLLVLFALASLLLLFRDRLSCLSCRCCRIPRAMAKDVKERRPSRVKRIAGVAISQRRDSDSDSDSDSQSRSDSDSDQSRSSGGSVKPADGEAGIDPGADHTALSIESQLGPASPTGHHNPASPSQCDLQMTPMGEKRPEAEAAAVLAPVEEEVDVAAAEAVEAAEAAAAEQQRAELSCERHRHAEEEQLAAAEATAVRAAKIEAAAAERVARLTADTAALQRLEEERLEREEADAEAAAEQQRCVQLCGLPPSMAELTAAARERLQLEQGAKPSEPQWIAVLQQALEHYQSACDQFFSDHPAHPPTPSVMLPVGRADSDAVIAAPADDAQSAPVSFDGHPVAGAALDVVLLRSHVRVQLAAWSELISTTVVMAHGQWAMPDWACGVDVSPAAATMLMLLNWLADSLKLNSCVLVVFVVSLFSRFSVRPPAAAHRRALRCACQCGAGRRRWRCQRQC